jgi:hypothetical protein
MVITKMQTVSRGQFNSKHLLTPTGSQSCLLMYATDWY